MSKGKIIIEVEGSDAQTLSFDELHVEMSQTIYGFSNLGELRMDAMAPDGEMRIYIRGINNEAAERFRELCGKYHIVERVG